MKTLRILPIQNTVLGQNRVQPGVPENMLPDFIEEFRRPGQRMNWTDFFHSLPQAYQVKARQDKYRSQKRAPNAVDPNAVDPNAADPSAADPSAADPSAADPSAADPSAPTGGGIWNSVKNWFSGGEGAAAPQAQEQEQAAPQALGASQLSQDLYKAIKGFGRAYNAQAKQYNLQIQAIHKLIKGLASQQGAQMIQFNPQMSGQIQQVIDTLVKATNDEANDLQFLTNLSQQADALAKSMGVDASESAYSRRVAMSLTASTATPSVLFLR